MNTININSNKTSFEAELDTRNIDPSFAIASTTKDTIEKFKSDSSLSLEEKGVILRSNIRDAMEEVNSIRKVLDIKRVHYDDRLNEDSIAAILTTSREYIKISCTNGPASSNVCFYVDNPLDTMYGIYVSINEDDFIREIKEIQPGFPSKDAKNVMTALRSIIPTKEKGINSDLCWLKNGIFNYKTKELLPFTPDLISLSKSNTNYNPNAEDIELEPGYYIHNIIEDLSMYEDTRLAIYQSIGAAIRSDKKWDRMVWFYGRRGRNGKTMCATIMREIVGSDAYTEMPVKAYSSSFGLSSIIGKHLLIASDSNSHEFINEPENLKAMTGGGDDTVQINRKYKDPLTYKFTGLILMLMNDFPQFSPEDAINRRIFPIEFERSFEDCPNTAIIDDYIHRKEVKEWIVKHVLTEIPDYETLTPSPRCSKLLCEISLNNDAVRRFINDGILEEIMHPMGLEGKSYPISMTTAYQIYKVWCEREGETMSEKMTKKTFVDRLSNILLSNPSINIEIVKDPRKPELYRDGGTLPIANAIRLFFEGSKKYESYIRQIAYYKGDEYWRGIEGMIPTRPTSYIRAKESGEPVVENTDI